MRRPTPFELVFESLAPERFPAVREALAGRDATDRDRFLVEPEVVRLVHELRPDEGVGEGIDELTAFLHHAYLIWAADTPAVELPATRLPELLSAPAPAGDGDGAPLPPFYAQLPERRVWGEPVAGAPHEPLDGLALHAAPDGALRVLGVFGLHPERMGLTVVETVGRRPPALARGDGTPLFAPALPGGAAAGLHSIVGQEELLELGHRLREVAR